MSMHKIPLTDIERDGLIKHGLDIGTPSQLSDAFRHGVAHGIASMKTQPIDMVLHCPKCGKQHIDAPNTLQDIVHKQSGTVVDQLWSNPPHRSHLCHGCGHIWRPADVPTNGVQAVKTEGKADSPIAQPIPSELEADAANLLFALHDAWPYVHQFCTIESKRKNMSDLMRKHGDFADFWKKHNAKSTPAPISDFDQQLATFYNAKDCPDLVRCMEHHIHKLQTALRQARPNDGIAVTPVRQG